MPILMKEAEKKTFEIDGESVIINKATGYNDGYYWDYNIKFLYKGFEYHLCEYGSFSGYTVPNKQTLKTSKTMKRCEKGLNICSKSSEIKKNTKKVRNNRHEIWRNSFGCQSSAMEH